VLIHLYHLFQRILPPLVLSLYLHRATRHQGPDVGRIRWCQSWHPLGRRIGGTARAVVPRGYHDVNPPAARFDRVKNRRCPERPFSMNQDAVGSHEVKNWWLAVSSDRTANW